MLKYIPFAEMAKIYNVSSRPNLFIAWQIKGTDVVLYTGTHVVVIVPCDWFSSQAEGLDFDSVEVVDHGSAVKIGELTVSTDTILAEFRHG